MIHILHSQRAAKKKQNESPRGGPAEWGEPSHCAIKRRSSMTAGGTIWSPPALAGPLQKSKTRQRPSSLNDKHKTKADEKRQPRVQKKHGLEEYDKNNKHAYIDVTNEDIVLRSTLKEHEATDKKCSNIIKEFDGVKDLIAKRAAEKRATKCVVNIEDDIKIIESESYGDVDCGGEHLEAVEIIGNDCYVDEDVDMYVYETNGFDLECQMACVGIDN